MAASRREFKHSPAEDSSNATGTKPVEGGPGQDGPRHTEKRDSVYTTRSHKSISRLPDSPTRMDSREQMYSVLSAWSGQSHD